MVYWSIQILMFNIKIYNFGGDWWLFILMHYWQNKGGREEGVQVLLSMNMRNVLTKITRQIKNKIEQ